jgi:hypothetical protein
MARNRGEAVAKRAREQARQARRETKQAKREARSNDTATLSATSETALLNEFAQLSAEYEADAISHDRYTSERSRILTELGIETD